MRISRIVLAAALGGALATPALADDRMKTVAITAIVEHPALDATRDGVIAALKEAGFTPGETLTVNYQSAQGNPATAAQIARKFVGERPNVIVPISTPSAQAVVAATRDVPVVFTAVTDPVGAQLVRSMEQPGGNVTGLSDMAPVGDHVALITEILPNARRIGVVYNPGEPNSVTMVKVLKDEATARGLTVVEATATKSADVQAAGRSLVGKADAVYVPLDNTVVSALEALIQVGAQADLPIFSADTDSVERGTAASMGFDYFELGKQTGAVVARVLKGEKPADIPVRVASGTNLVVNPAAAESMGFAIPDSVLGRATKVVGK
ncbi:ABC transporter substrate-binding protein [Azospirillum halopraeferens]|uniref:ABC transporter substrate-binding protein n=1 Tax=Azospirillum halopraeferens TaxID=34010 RepID=UPI0003F620CE|nr:ABC transporter substrate-binding protein [Azospirillum halopraeferens]